MLMGFLIGGFQPQANAQTLGSWVISTVPQDFDPSSTQQPYFYELVFTPSGISQSYLSQSPQYDNQKTSTANANSPEKDLACYLFTNGNQIDFYNSAGVLKQTHAGFYGVTHTSQIVPRSTTTGEYCAVYRTNGDKKEDLGYLWVTRITNPDGNLSIEEHHCSTKLFESPDFCISEDIEGDRSIYYSSNAEGLCRVSMEDVIDDYAIAEVIIDKNNATLSSHFKPHEMETKQMNGVTTVAWTSLESSGNLYMVNIYEQGNTIIVCSVGKGKIAGIEFSAWEEDIIYLSCETDGIIKYNYATQQIVSTLTPNGDYNRTSLQTAPDGYIYAVNNSGSYLGRINQIESLFEVNIFQIPTVGNSGLYGFLAEKTVIWNEDYTNYTIYYTLPKQDVLISKVDVVDESCPDVGDGEVTIFVSGGVPDYTISCFMGTTEITDFYYDPTEFSFNKEYLSEGDYNYTISDARGSVTIGTFHIGVYDDYYDYKDNPFEVSATRSLPDADMPLNTYSFEKGILIRSGATLTITGSVYEFGVRGKIIIEPGATLVLEGTTLTNHEECNLMWQGVEVQGNDAESQLPELVELQWIYHQGRILMHNATISNAYQAVSLFAHDNSGEIDKYSGGGIIVANNSSFINNANSVQFIPYKNFNPGSIAQIDNMSYFSNCNFEINEFYLGDEIFSNHVNLYGVKGIDFRGCDFSNTALSNISTTNMGIVAYGSGFTVTSLCSQQIDPCPAGSVVPSTFTGFYNAISVSSNSLYPYTYLIENSLLSNNKIGILNEGVKYPVIINNEFFIGHDHPDLTYGGHVGLGVDCQQSTGFAIENNRFYKNSAAPLGSYIGVRIKETKTGFDEVYKNTFDGLAGGNLSEGQNWRLYPYNRWIGLAYYCNENDNNWADFYVSEERPSGIQARQGDDDHAAGNTFSASATWHFYNGGFDEIGYYYNENIPAQVPDDKKLYHVTDEARNNVNTCPEHYTGGGSILLTSVQKTDKETDFLNNLYNYNSVEAQYEALIDGGDTPSELSDIQNATPDEMWDLRTKLLGDSPHLSLEVLMETSDRTDIFPDDVLFDILAANPDELKKDTLISYLENKENPLPDYMIAILLQVAQGTTYKTVLQNQMSLYNQYKTKAANDMVRSLLNDSITNLTGLRNWLDNTSTLRADEQIIATYMHEGNYSDALVMANLIPETYNFSDEELTEHTNYVTLLNLQIAMAQANRNVFQLDSTEFNTVLSLAINSKGTGGVLARNMLTYAYGYNFYTFPELNDTASYKIQPTGWDNFIEWSGIEISAKPNPAREWTAFDYVLPGADSKGSIVITDVSGRLIQTIPVSGMQGQEVWDTRDVKAGVYLFTLSSGGINKTGKIVVNK